MGTFIWYSKNSSSRLFSLLVTRKLLVTTILRLYPIGQSFRAIYMISWHFWRERRGCSHHLFGSGEAKTLLVMKYRRFCHASFLFWPWTLHREGRSIGFIYFGGKMRNKPTKSPKFVGSQPNLKQYNITYLNYQFYRSVWEMIAKDWKLLNLDLRAFFKLWSYLSNPTGFQWN